MKFNDVEAALLHQVEIDRVGDHLAQTRVGWFWRKPVKLVQDVLERALHPYADEVHVTTKLIPDVGDAGIQEIGDFVRERSLAVAYQLAFEVRQSLPPLARLGIDRGDGLIEGGRDLIDVVARGQRHRHHAHGDERGQDAFQVRHADWSASRAPLRR